MFKDKIMEEYLANIESLHDYPIGSVEYNKWLCFMFPWVIPHNRFTDNVPSNYDYSYTELDNIPIGWRKAFGEILCFELTNLLDKVNYTHDYRISQVKEKFGELRWYDNGVPIDIFDDFHNVIDKYVRMSRKRCVMCGEPATKITTGWISPYCDDCILKIHTFGDTIAIPDSYDDILDKLVYHD